MIRNELFDGRGTCLSAEIIDLAAGTISFEELGVVKSSRPLTADEVARYTPKVPEPTPEEKLAVVKAKLAELEALAAPVVAADILDVLAEIQEAI
jgi:hypothetical protein